MENTYLSVTTISEIAHTQMESFSIFLSIGATSNDKQETFIQAIEERLRVENLISNTIGRSQFSADSPLKAVVDCMHTCSGAMIVALERTYFPIGIEKRGGPKQLEIKERKYATPWNQIEAALAYSKKLPIMVIVEQGVQEEGLLEKGYDWYVMSVDPDPQILNTKEFNGVLASWKRKVKSYSENNYLKTETDIANLPLSVILKSLKPGQVWAILAALVSIITGSFLIAKLLFTG